MKLTAKTWNPSALNVVREDIPSLYDLSVEKGARKNILLLKVPYCTYPRSRYASHENTSFDLKSTYRPVPSLAIAALAAFFDKHKRYDYDLKVVDLNIEAYTKPNEPIDTRVYPRLLEKTIIESRYNILALSAMFIFSHRWVDDAVQLSRRYHPNARIIIGGGYPTLYPERVLNNHGIDAAVVGEGEDTFLHLVNRFNNVVDHEFDTAFPFEGYAARGANGGVFFVPRTRGFIDMGEVPPAAWHYLDINKYFRNSGDRLLPIEASRGCPFACTYCNTYISWGRSLRYKNIDNLIREIRSIQATYGITRIHFVDDNLSHDKEWIVEFLSRLSREKLSLAPSCSNFSVKRLDEEIVDLLFEVGVEEIVIAIESGSKEIRKRILKPTDMDHVARIVNHIKSRGKRINVLWMAGFPKETRSQLDETFGLARELRAHHNGFSIVMPYPGTKLYDDAKNMGALRVDDADLEQFDNRKGKFFNEEEWTYEELRQMVYDANVELNYLDNPDLETAEGRRFLFQRVRELVLSLPEHVIWHILLGYIARMDNRGDYEQYYDAALNLLERKELRITFERYLSWDNPVIRDFSRYARGKSGPVADIQGSGGDIYIA